MASGGSDANARIPQYVDSETGMSYEHEPVVRRKPCAQEQPAYERLAPAQGLRNRQKAPPVIPAKRMEAHPPQYVDPATGISYEHEPVVRRQKRPPPSPPSPDKFPSFSKIMELFPDDDEPQSPMNDSQYMAALRSAGRPTLAPVPKSPGPPQSPRTVFPRQPPYHPPPQYVDPATGKSYEDEPVVLRKKNIAPPGTPPRPNIPSAVPDSPEESILEVSFHNDDRFASERIVALNDNNFDAYIKQMEKALVYFYHMQQAANRKLEDEFSDAADKSVHANYGYAAVNCFREPWLCSQHKTMQKTPMIKLYSNGFEMSNIDRASEMNADQMNMLMKMTPVLNQPRVEIGKQLQSEAREDSPMKKRPFLMCK